MTASLFTEEGKQQFISRVENLQPGALPKWGKMNAAQMLTHCQVALNTSLQGKELDEDGFGVKLMSFLFGKMAKKQMLGANGMKKNMPTAKAFRITDSRNFEAEKEQLITAIGAMQEKGAKGDLAGRHPFFGTMSISDWELLHTKHLDHHLTQFGV